MSDKFIERHIVDCVRAGMAEAQGQEAEANLLRAQAKLRIVSMSDEDLWELARHISPSSESNIDESYAILKRVADQHRADADNWLSQLFESPKTEC